MDRAASRLEILHELTSGLAERMELQSIAAFVLGVGLDTIAANRGTLCRLTPDGLSLEVVAHAGYDTEMMDSWRVFPVSANFPASDVVRTRAPIYLHSPQERGLRYPAFAETGGDGASAMLPLLLRDEVLGAIVFGFEGPRDFDDADRLFLAALAAQCAIALDRARMYDAALRRQADLSLVAKVATALTAAGDDLHLALQRFVEIACPGFVDIASIHLLESPEVSRLAAGAFVGSDNLSATERVNGFGVDLTAAHGLGSVLRTGVESTWCDASQFIEQIARDDDDRAALSAMDLGAGIIVPMRVGDRVTGACLFANRRDRFMSDDDRSVARTLGERAAVLLDNARLMRQRKEVSRGLQAALLPPSLPAVPGFEIGARYQSAGEGLEVGGDFYDVVPVIAGWLLVVGDVTGHGVEAAAATALVRHTIRSAAMMGMGPAQVLDHTNNAMVNSAGALPKGVYCTIALIAIVATADDSGGTSSRVVVSCGGHPAPLVRRAAGHVEQLEAHGRLLGYFPSVGAEEIPVDLGPGDTLVAFTDGVVERHHDGDWFRQPDLAKLLADNPLDADATAGLIRDAVVDAFATPPSDDMAILVLRRSPG